MPAQNISRALGSGGRGWAAGVQWLPAASPENPFGVEVLDCRAACKAFWAAVEAQETSPLVDGLAGLAAANARPLRPQDSITQDLRLSFVARYGADGLPVAAVSPPGTRWTVGVGPAEIAMRRTLSGETVHAAAWKRREDGLEFTRLTSLSGAVHASPAFAAAEFEFLARIFISGVMWPFPVPPGLSHDDRAEIAISGWREYGRLAQFARPIAP